MRDPGNESVADLWDRLDVAGSPRRVTESLPEIRDVPRKSYLPDKSVGPERAHQFILRKKPAGACNKRDERIEHLWRECNRPAVAQESSLGNVEPVRPEFEGNIGLL